MSIGLVADSVFQEHDPGSFHPETPERLRAFDQALEGWPRRSELEALPLSPVSEEDLLLVHRPKLVQAVMATSGRSVSLDPDTSTSPRSAEVARLAAGSLVELCNAVLSDDLRFGLAMVRPPGHHATPTRAMGFCLFNNAAVASAHLLVRRGLKRVLIVDWDVHHGNGTEEIFFGEDRVLYFSTHQSPFYPGTGPAQSVGSGSGEGYNVNLPLSYGQGDEVYLHAFEHLLAPIAREFKPQFIMVSAGFDAHREDPLGGMRISSAGYGAMTRVLVELCEEFCPGKLVLTLEGGYNPAAQARSLLACLDAFLSPQGQELRQKAQDREMPGPVAAARKVQGSYWSLD